MVHFVMHILILLCIMLMPIESSSLASVAQVSAPVARPWTQARIIRTIITTAHKHRVNPAIALAIAEIESSFNPDALRREDHLDTASVGIFQILHTTARGEFGFKGSIKQLKNPAVNIPLGIRYLKKCGGEDDLLYLACCYQAGFGADPVFCATHPGVRNYHRKLEEKSADWADRLAE